MEKMCSKECVFFVSIKIIQNHCLICIIWYNTNEGGMIL